MFKNLSSVIGAQDDVLLGRGTFDYWVDYWPTTCWNECILGPFG